MIRARTALAAFLLAVSNAAAAQPAAAERVDVELLLAVDVSGSMDTIEHRLQRQGYVRAIAHPDVVRAILGGSYGRIALTYIEWAGPYSHSVTVLWTVIASAGDAEAFAAELAAAPVAVMRGTSLSGIIDRAVGAFAGNTFDGLKTVLDISGDGPNNLGGPVVPARNRAVDAGIVINGLPLMLRPRLSGRNEPTLDAYYEACVIGGPGAFVLPVDDPEHLETAIRRKLVWDIAGHPARLWRAQAGAPAPIDCLIGEKQRALWDDP